MDNAVTLSVCKGDDPMPATDAMLASITALQTPITLRPFSDVERRVLRRDMIGLGVILLALALFAGIGAMQSRHGGGGYAPQEKVRW